MMIPAYQNDLQMFPIFRMQFASLNDLCMALRSNVKKLDLRANISGCASYGAVSRDFSAGISKFTKLIEAQKHGNFFIKKQESDGNRTFQGVKSSRLKSPVCEVACGVVTTTGQLRGRTVIGPCKDRSPW